MNHEFKLNLICPGLFMTRHPISYLVFCALLCTTLCACEDKKTPATPEEQDEQSALPSISAEPSTEATAKKNAPPVLEEPAARDDARGEQPGGPQGKVVFSRRNDRGDLELFVLDLSKEEPTQLFAHKSETNSNLMFPLWNKDASRIEFAMYEGDRWITASIKPDGSDLQKDPAKAPDMLSRNSRAEDITVENGKVVIKDEAGKDVELYVHDDYDFKNNAGPAAASWSSDKQYVIFELCGTPRCEVRIVDTKGALVRTIPDAEMPDWSAGS